MWERKINNLGLFKGVPAGKADTDTTKEEDWRREQHPAQKDDVF